MSDAHISIKDRLEQLALDLTQPFEGQYPSLLTGDMGDVIFFMYYYRYTGNELWYDRAIERLEWIINRIDELPQKGGFCGGLSGTFWGVEHLIEQDFLDPDTRESLLVFDDYLGQEMVRNMAEGNFDFLHGAGGIALYLLKRLPFNAKVEGYLDEVVELLYKDAEVVDGHHVKWVMKPAYADPSKALNIGLAHGMAGIVLLLVRLIKAGVQADICRDLLDKAVRFVLTQEQDINKYYSYFPTTSVTIEDATRTSRLAWCYGDLGIGMMLYQAAEVAVQSSWHEKSIEVLGYAGRRRDLQKNAVYDAGLCHGSAGLAQIFQRMFIETELPAFQEARQYWNQQTLLMAQPAKGVGGYLPFIRNTEAPMYITRNLLEGAAGIGLSLIHADSDILPDWDGCLLLS